MAGNKRLLLFSLLIVLCLWGCGSAGTEEPATNGKEYIIYYTNLEGNSLQEKSYTAVSDRFEGLLQELLQQFTVSPYSDVSSAVPLGISINGYTLGVDDMQVDFNAAYLGLSNTQEILLRAGLVKTLVQLPGVTRVAITVEGQALRDYDGREVSYMNENTFIDNQGNGINSYHYITLDLYFANAKGDKVVKEMRNVYYSSNLSIEKVIVEQIIQGPVNKKLQPVTDPSVLVRNVTISKGICVVDLDSRFNISYNLNVEPETCLYAFVNAICDACDVGGVSFRIDGKSDVRFRGKVNLDQVFTRDADMIESSGVSEVLDGVVLDENGEQAENTNELSAERETEPETETEYTRVEAKDETGDHYETEELKETAPRGAEYGVGLDPALMEDHS